MVNTLNPTNNVIENSTYSTPFNVDFFEVKPKNFFAEYTERVLSLPESLKNILMDYSTAIFIEENIGLNFNLNKEQITELTRIIRDVLLADLFIGEMAQNISLKAKISPDETKRIKDSIVSVLFKPAAEDIKKLQTERFPEKISRSNISTESQDSKISEKTDLKIEPNINRNNIVDLRNKQ